MKDIRLIQLELLNFKCHAHLRLDFNGRNAAIFGDNATGKTSIYDALVWLLFGKDSQGNGEKGIDLKPLGPDGLVKDHDAITEVEAVLDAGGEEVSLKRTLREVWTNRRGSTELRYDGNVSDYFVNGVPCKKNAFDKTVSELCPEDLFRMLTSVSWFASGMKWQDRRGILFDMAGRLTDADLMDRDDRFRELAQSMGKLSLSDYKAKLLHQKRALTGTREDAPARISECQRQLEGMGMIDEEALRVQEQELAGIRDRLSGEIIAMEQDAAIQGKRLELREAQLAQEQIQKENRLYREAQQSRGQDREQILKNIRAEEVRCEMLEGTIRRADAGIDRDERALQETRELWVQVNGEAFAGGICPSCGQALPYEKLRAATEGFEARKKQRLADIEREAERTKERLQEASGILTERREELSFRREQIAGLRKQLKEAQAATITDMPGYRERLEKAAAATEAVQKELRLLTERGGEAIAGKRRELEETGGKLEEVRKKLAQRSYRDSLNGRIAELKADMKNAAEALEAIEKMLCAMEDFVRFKCRFVEESVNDHFRLASFRLFREQANGGIEERCDAQQGGVPYMSLNNGMKINVGIDIINALSRHYGITVPLFVDNAEAVTRLEECRSQVIRLVVSENDKELRVHYEN